MKNLLKLALAILLVAGLFTACYSDIKEPAVPPVFPASPEDTGTKVLLQFTSHQDGSTIQWVSDADNPSTAKVSYCIDGGIWIEQDLSDAPQAITVNAGQTVYFKGNNDTINAGYDDYSYFEMTGSFTGKGNLMSLLDPTFTKTDVPDYAFIYLFYECSALTDFSLIIDADTIGAHAFEYAFSDVGNVTVSDILADAIGQDAFYSAFYYSTGDVTIGDIKADTIGDGAFCVALSNSGNAAVGDIEFTEAGYSAFNSMFYCQGDVTVGNITVNGSLGDYQAYYDSPFSQMFYECNAFFEGAEEGLHTVNVGDVRIKGDAGDYSLLGFFYDCTFADISMGNLTIDGDLGEYALQYFFYDCSFYSNAKIEMGNVEIGGSVGENAFFEMFYEVNCFEYDPEDGFVADPDRGHVYAGTLSIGGDTDASSFAEMISDCDFSIWSFGDVTVAGTTAEGTFDKNPDNFLCGVTPVNSDTFKVNGVLYF